MTGPVRPPLGRHRGTFWRFAGILPLAVSGAICVAVSLCYAFRPDACAAVTLFPVWVWPLPGLLLVMLSWDRSRKRGVAVIALLWLLYLLVFAEEPWSLLRTLLPVRTSPETLRVVSLNCAGGSAEAAGEAARFRPDIVLLQESPGREEVERLGRQLFGKEAGVLWSLDASLLVHGSVRPAALPPAERMYFVQARVQLASGAEAEVISLRLLPPLFRMDLWNPECWRAQTENRRARREQLRAVAARIEAVPRDVPILLGGDLNAPQGDAVFRLLRPRLRDAFPVAGKGWGNTIINDLPFLRIDQVWASHGIEAVTVRAHRTQHSDHRLVACDLRLKRPAAGHAAR